MISEITHIPKTMTPWQIGWFVVAINLSDIAAKGGKPIGFLLSLGLPRDKNEDFLMDLINGAKACTSKYKTMIIGGDTKENVSITVCGTVLGIINKNNFMSRKGIKSGDIVAVTGSLGKAAAGFFCIENNLNMPEIIKGLFEPNPKIMEGLSLAKEKIVTASMDISDGLSSSLYQLADFNNIGFEIIMEKIPLSNELVRLSKEYKNLDTYKNALHFGGDYELLLTVNPKNFEIAQNCIKKIGGNLTEIGVATKEIDIFIEYKKVKKILLNKGYEHFI